MRRSLLFVFLMLCTCTPTGQQEIATRAFSPHQAGVLNNPFPVPNLPVSIYSNIDLTRDFLDLSFSLESGRALPMFTRFEGPISVRLSGHPASSLGVDLDRLIDRLRREADLDINFTQSEAANITIQSVSRARLRRALPNAACFVAPNVRSLSEFQQKRNTKVASWSHQTERRTVAIFLPSDASPQEVRDCLHEEFAQALGPLNDLYRLPNSVFNDDNVHTVLTRFDMMILKSTDAAELHSGMSRTQVQARLPSLLARINPRGDSLAPSYLKATPRAWIDAIQTSLRPNVSIKKRRESAQKSVMIAQNSGWQDHRLGVSYFTLALMIQPQDPAQAQTLFQAAMNLFDRSAESRLHGAYTASHLASFALIDGHAQRALDLVMPHIKVARTHENATLLVTLLLLQAEALDRLERHPEARSVRLDSLLWAGYGFGTERAWNTKQRDISELSRRLQNNG